MTVEVPRPVLQGKRALVVGIANEHSIAYGCARAFRELGADLAVTYLNERARPHVEPLATALGAPILAPLDVGKPGELEALFDRIAREWGSLDISSARPTDSRRPWTCRATRSSGWPGSPPPS